MAAVRVALGVTGLLALGCMMAPQGEDQMVLAPAIVPDGAWGGDEAGAKPGAPLMAMAPEPAARRDGNREEKDARSVADAEPEVAEEVVGGTEAAPAVRDWFPDTFVWVPVLETDDDGVATLDVTVPDSLTDWRVLGLAHDRTGQQAGAVTTFVSRLPVYVEPAVPAWLHTGDQLDLPVRAGNGTDGTLRASMSVSAGGALQGGGGADASLGPGGVVARTVRVTATRSGDGTVRASVAAGAERDTVERRIRVVPTGQPVQTSAAGTVRDAVELALARPEAGSDEELTVTVVAGPMPILAAELERAASGRTALPGAGLALAAEAEAVAERVGATLDEGLVRRVRLVGYQAVARSLATPSAAVASDLLFAAGADSRVAGFEAARAGLADKVVAAQRPDGTWSWQDRSTVQQMLIETAHAAGALPEDRTTARLRAQGACERHAPAADDPYTAAVLLGSGLVGEGLAETLLERVRGGLVRDDAGAPSVAVPRGVVNAWGAAPSEVEMLAWTVLALPEADPDRGPLAATLAGRWSPGIGFGAGRAELVALRALIEAAPGADRATTAQLWVGETMVADSSVDPAGTGAPAVLRGPGADGARLVLDPPVDGVVWTAVRRAWVPLDPEVDGLSGVEVRVGTDGLRAGVEGTVSVTLSAPTGVRLTVEQGLPAGAVVDAARVTGGVATVLPDRVRIEVPSVGAGAHEIGIPVTPAFGGRFTTAPLTVTVDGAAQGVWAPTAWAVQP